MKYLKTIRETFDNDYSIYDIKNILSDNGIFGSSDKIAKEISVIDSKNLKITIEQVDRELLSDFLLRYNEINEILLKYNINNVTVDFDYNFGIGITYILKVYIDEIAKEYFEKLIKKQNKASEFNI